MVFGVPKKKRDNYLIWEERKCPDVIIEATSKTTVKEDIKKKELYRVVLKVKEYFLFDPTADYLDPRLQGFRLSGELYKPIKMVDGRLPSKQLGLHLEADGDDLRFFDPVTNSYLPTPEERAERGEVRAEQEKQRAEREKLRAEQERQRAEEEKLRAEQEKQRADGLAAELERSARNWAGSNHNSSVTRSIDMTSADIVQNLETKFGPKIKVKKLDAIDPFVVVAPADLVEICQYPARRPQSSFRVLNCISGVDYLEPDPKKVAKSGFEPHLEVVYHLQSYTHRHRFVVKVSLPRWKNDTPGQLPEVPTLTGVWLAADWHEREVYDLSGVWFVGHPDLRRFFVPTTGSAIRCGRTMSIRWNIMAFGGVDR